MRYVICILCCFFTTIASNHLSAQQDEQKDFIIEIPVKIDILYNDIYIDSAKFEEIKQNSKWCSFTIIENLDNQPTFSQKKEGSFPSIILPFVSEMKDTLVIIVSDNSTEIVNKLIIVLGLNQDNELRCFYKTSDDKKYKNFVFYDNEQYIPLKFIFRKDI